MPNSGSVLLSERLMVDLLVKKKDSRVRDGGICHPPPRLICSPKHGLAIYSLTLPQTIYGLGHRAVTAQRNRSLITNQAHISDVRIPQLVMNEEGQSR